jgi:RNA recognition motif-containing protein
MKLYVGNLAYSATDDTLREVFGAFGQVSSATVITDRETGRSKGFGFVEFSSDDDARQAIDSLNGKEVDGRVLKVNEARPRSDAPRGGGGRGGERRGGGGGGGGGGYGGGDRGGWR